MLIVATFLLYILHYQNLGCRTSYAIGNIGSNVADCTV